MVSVCHEGTKARRLQGHKSIRAQEHKNRGRRQGFYGPGDGNGGRDFFLEDFGEFFSFCLTVESSLYKYMRICLWSDI